MQSEKTFHSCVINGGDFIHPESLEVGDDYLTYERQSFFGRKKQAVTIYLANIIAIEMYTRFTGVNLIIKTRERSISCHGLSRRKVRKVKSLIGKF